MFTTSQQQHLFSITGKPVLSSPGRKTTSHVNLSSFNEFKYVNLNRASAMYAFLQELDRRTNGLDENQFIRLLSDNQKVRVTFTGRVSLAHALSYEKVFGHPISEFYVKLFLGFKFNPNVFLGVPVSELPVPRKEDIILAMHAFLGVIPVWDMFCFTIVSFFRLNDGFRVVSSDWVNALHGREVLESDLTLDSLRPYSRGCPSVAMVKELEGIDEIDRFVKLSIFRDHAYKHGHYPYPNPDTYGLYGVLNERLFDLEQCVIEYTEVSAHYYDQCFSVLEVESDEQTVVNVETVNVQPSTEVDPEPGKDVAEAGDTEQSADVYEDVEISSVSDLGGMSVRTDDSAIEMKPIRVEVHEDGATGSTEISGTKVKKRKKYFRKASVIGPNKYAALLCIAVCLANVSAQRTDSHYFRCFDIPKLKYEPCPDDTVVPGHTWYRPYYGGVAVFDDGGIVSNMACVDGNAVTAVVGRPPEYPATCSDKGDCMIEGYRYCIDLIKRPPNDSCVERLIRYGDDEAPREAAITNYTMITLGDDAMVYVPGIYKRGMYGAGVFCDGGKLLGTVTSVDFANKGLIIQNYTKFEF